MKTIIMLLMILHSLTLFGQVITKTEVKYNVMINRTEIQHEKYSHYTVMNNDTVQILLLFTEDKNTHYPLNQLLKRKLLRRYGDFNLAMLEWENMQVDDSCANVPCLFAKTIGIGESFDIIIGYSNGLNSYNDMDFSEHFIICKEDDLSELGFPNFINYIKGYNFEYPYSFLMLSLKSISSFIANL